MGLWIRSVSFLGLLAVVAAGAAGPAQGEESTPEELTATFHALVSASPLAGGRYAPGVEAPEPYVPQTACHPFEKPGVQAFRDVVLGMFPRTEDERKYYNIITECNVDGVSEHREGRAYDFKADIDDPVQKAQADALLQWLTENDGAQAKRFGIMYLIWDQQIWNTRSLTWRPMEDRGDDTTNHRDHIHISFSWNGALKQSSYWSGQTPAPNYGWCQEYRDQFAPAGDADAVPNRSEPCPMAPGPQPQLWQQVSGQSIDQGDTGARVEMMSEYLQGLGYAVDELTYFTPTTYLTVRQFQLDHGITPTGSWDAETQYHTGVRFNPERDLSDAR